MDKHDFFFKTAILLSAKSNCVSKQVGAIIVKNGRIISTGYNGTPTGHKNCCDKFDRNSFDREKHHEWSNVNEIHAEMNAVNFAAKNGLSIDGATIYCTLEPCYNCLKNLIATGITSIYYFNKYDKAVTSNDIVDYIKYSEDIIYTRVSSKSLEDFQEYINNSMN